MTMSKFNQSTIKSKWNPCLVDHQTKTQTPPLLKGFLFPETTKTMSVGYACMFQNEAWHIGGHRQLFIRYIWQMISRTSQLCSTALNYEYWRLLLPIGGTTQVWYTDINKIIIIQSYICNIKVNILNTLGFCYQCSELRLQCQHAV